MIPDCWAWKKYQSQSVTWYVENSRTQGRETKKENKTVGQVYGLILPYSFVATRANTYLTLVLRVHYTICRYMFKVGLQCNFQQITASFSAGRRQQFVVSDMLLVWCFWLSTGKRRIIKLDLVTAGQFFFHFSRVLGSVVDCMNVNPMHAWHLTMPCVMRRTCAH